MSPALFRLMEWHLETGDVKSVEEVSGGGIWSMTSSPQSGHGKRTPSGKETSPRDGGGEMWLGLSCDDGAVRFYSIECGGGCAFLGLLPSSATRYAVVHRPAAAERGDGE